PRYPLGNNLQDNHRVTQDTLPVMAVTAAATAPCERDRRTPFHRQHVWRSAVALAATAMRWNLIIGEADAYQTYRRVGRYRPRCFAFERGAQPSLHSATRVFGLYRPGRGCAGLRLQFLSPMRGKYVARRLHRQPVARAASDGARFDCFLSASSRLSGSVSGWHPPME